MTDSTTEMASSETTIMQTSEMNGMETSERLEEIEDIAEMLGIISAETTPIKWCFYDYWHSETKKYCMWRKWLIRYNNRTKSIKKDEWIFKSYKTIISEISKDGKLNE